MKMISFLLALLMGSATLSAGQIIYKTMYVTNTIVQGTGQTYEAAVADALGAIPNGYQRDPVNGQVIECTLSEDLLRATSGERCDTSIPGNQFRITIPVVAKQ